MLRLIYVFLVLFTIFQFELEKFKRKNCKYIYFYQKFVQLVENTLQKLHLFFTVHFLMNFFFYFREKLRLVLLGTAVRLDWLTLATNLDTLTLQTIFLFMVWEMILGTMTLKMLYTIAWMSI